MAVHWLVATGGVSPVFPALLVAVPPHAASHLVATILGVYALVFGVSFLLASLGFRTAARA